MAYKAKNPFYDDPKWVHKRGNILRRDEYLCRQCRRYGKTTPAKTVHHIYPYGEYPQYRLTDINLLSLCSECHNGMHDRNNDTMTDKGIYWQDKIRKELGIEDHDIIEGFRVVVVWGSPASGKTTYVKQHMKQGDMVVDLDNIKQAISLHGKTASMSNLMPVALDIRAHIYDLIADRQTIKADTVWVVAGLPKQSDRDYIKAKLRPNEMKHIDSNVDTCIAHALEDKERVDKEIQLKIIYKWFEEYDSPAS